MTTSPLPVVRAWRPFLRRISMWKEALGSSDTAVLARRDALREELAGAPSLACDVVGVLVTLALIAGGIESLGWGKVIDALATVVGVCVVWLLPGHRWYVAPLRPIAGVFVAYVIGDLNPHRFDDWIVDTNVRPPVDALTLPIALPLALVGLLLVAAGARQLARQAPALPDWGRLAAVASAVFVIGGCAFDYYRGTQDRLRRHEAYAQRIVELRNAPRSSILAVEDALANRNVTGQVDSLLRDLEAAFPNDPQVVSLRRSVTSLADARDRAAAAEEARAARSRAYVERMQDIVFNRCVNECITPGLACFNSGMSDDFCRANYKNIEQCRFMCAR